jgi:hypothetical protein
MSEFEAVQIAASDFVVLKECPASNDREAYISCVTHLQIEFENSPISFMLKYADKYSLLVNPLDLLNNE